PSGAIAIRIVNVEDPTFRQRFEGSMLPDVMRADYTHPTTRYISSKPIPVNAKSADAESSRAEEAHTPLVLMLVLTQVAVAALIFSGKDAALRWIGFAAASLGILASVSHLGQPLKAW